MTRKKTKSSLKAILIIAMVIFVANSIVLAETQTAGKSSLININTASAAQLIKLPRVGEKIAARIIEYRNKNGKFKRIQEIMKVKGIGEKTFENFKEQITI